MAGFPTLKGAWP